MAWMAAWVTGQGMRMADWLINRTSQQPAGPPEPPEDRLQCSQACSDTLLNHAVESQTVVNTIVCQCDITPLNAGMRKTISLQGSKKSGLRRTCQVSAAATLSCCTHGSHVCIKLETLTGSVANAPPGLVLENLRASFWMSASKAGSAPAEGISMKLRSKLTVDRVPLQSVPVLHAIRDKLRLASGEIRVGPTADVNIATQTVKAGIGHWQRSFKEQLEIAAQLNSEQKLVFLQKGLRCAPDAHPDEFTVELQRDWRATLLSGQRGSAQGLLFPLQDAGENTLTGPVMLIGELDGDLSTVAEVEVCIVIKMQLAYSRIPPGKAKFLSMHDRPLDCVNFDKRVNIKLRLQP